MLNGHEGYIISFLLLVISILLTIQTKHNSDNSKEQRLFNNFVRMELTNRVAECTCKERRDACPGCRAKAEFAEFWTALNKHSHTGLDKDSEVLRR